MIKRALVLSSVALMALVSLTSCTTVSGEKGDDLKRNTTLIVTRAGNESTLSWLAEKDTIYSVMYADQRDVNARWQVLPGYEQVQKPAGETIVINDKVPTGATRYYRLQVTPSASLR